MQLYVILRRNGWMSPEDFKAAAERAAEVGNGAMREGVRARRRYALDEGAGSLGTVCIYEGVSPEAIVRHAALSGLPADEVIPVADTIIVRPDPVAAAV